MVVKRWFWYVNMAHTPYSMEMRLWVCWIINDLIDRYLLTVNLIWVDSSGNLRRDRHVNKVWMLKLIYWRLSWHWSHNNISLIANISWMIRLCNKLTNIIICCPHKQSLLLIFWDNRLKINDLLRLIKEIREFEVLKCVRRLLIDEILCDFLFFWSKIRVIKIVAKHVSFIRRFEGFTKYRLEIDIFHPRMWEYFLNSFVPVWYLFLQKPLEKVFEFFR